MRTTSAVVHREAEDAPPASSAGACPKSDQRVGNSLNDRRLAAADLGAELYGVAVRGADMEVSAVARWLGIHESTVRVWATQGRLKAVTLRDVIAGPPSVCRFVGAGLVAIATPPPPARSQEAQLLDVASKMGDLARAMLAGGPAVERAVLALEDSTAALRAMRTRRQP